MIFDTKNFGKQVKILRKQQGLTLAKLADKIGRSVSLLSQIENGNITPSFSTMQGIADALQVSFTQIISEGRSSEEGDSFLIKALERKILVTSGGVLHQFLSRGVPTSFKLMIVEVPPGASTGKTLYRHKGVECGFLLEGELAVEINGQVHRLTPGDSITFRSTSPHKLSNSGQTKAVAVWVNSVPIRTTPQQP